MANKDIKFEDQITLKETVTVVRFKGSLNIKEMIKEGLYIEAFAHSQLGIEKILWDKIVGIFEPNKARIVREAINQTKQQTKTSELIKWARFLGAISKDEYSDLIDFNKKRNNITHIHGHWWNIKDFEQALQKGIRFLEKNGM